MHRPWRDIKISLGIFGAVFLLQLLLFFLDPAFYLSSVRQSEIPAFIKWSFAKYFLLVLACYLLAALAMGLFNHLIWRWVGPSSRSQGRDRIARIALQIGQFLGVGLWVAYAFPSVLDWIPVLDGLTLKNSFALLGIALLAAIGICITLQGSLRTRTLAAIAFALFLPVGLTWAMTLPSELEFPYAKASPAQRSIYLIGFDALDGESGARALETAGQASGGRIYLNAFTPLPSTHPAWNSILTGLFPERHRVRFFFESPEAGAAREFFLPLRLKQHGPYRTLFASDQPETSYFLKEHGFDYFLTETIGWEAHLRSIILNHFIFPALWLNNRWAETLTGRTLNSPSLFNYDLPRFFNFTFRKMAELPEGPRFLALHNCFLHSPIRLTGRELRSIPGYLDLSPRDFSYWAWPAPGDPPLSTPANWVNPYYVRRPILLGFLSELLRAMRAQGYLETGTAVLLSDHGERFAKGHEIYGGIHGIDIETREQNNILLAFFDGEFRDLKHIQEPVSLIDVAPTILEILGIPHEQPENDGIALLEKDRGDRPLPDRPLWIESMGFLQVPRNNASFPQIAVKTLEENLSYQPNGRVRVGREYYERILRNKKIVDLAESGGDSPR